MAPHHPTRTPPSEFRIRAVAPEPSVINHLTDATFIDAYQVVAPTPLSAENFARAAFEKPPTWISHLLALRNAAVAVFGLKTGREAGDPRDWIGIFPVEAMTPDRIVLGFDDKHLDFRVVVDVARKDNGCEITATTLVREHNLFGRIYLTTILPFHRAIVPVLLRRAAREAGGD